MATRLRSCCLCRLAARVWVLRLRIQLQGTVYLAPAILARFGQSVCCQATSRNLCCGNNCGPPSKMHALSVTGLDGDPSARFTSRIPARIISERLRFFAHRQGSTLKSLFQTFEALRKILMSLELSWGRWRCGGARPGRRSRRLHTRFIRFRNWAQALSSALGEEQYPFAVSEICGTLLGP